jgi:4-deoxy-L-threo-5-hexosulose-uronate ketol-isomerase
MSQNQSIRRMPRPSEVARMTTEELRESFLISKLLAPGALNVQFTDLDRFAVGGAVPTASALTLENHRETGRAFFLERRELGAINVGGAGTVTVDARQFEVAPEGCIYVSMGSKNVSFASKDPSNPAKFFILSCPAHAAYPTTVATPQEANTIPLGTPEQANKRVIRQYIHENGIKSCQLVMGYTELAEGCVWNTFPPHTHNRRTEVYLFLHEGDAVLSPSWSIHSGCGQGNYKFIWGMAGENQRFDDMDGVKPQDLR